MTKHIPSSKAKRRTLQSLLAASAIGLGVAGVVTQIDRGNPAEAAQLEEQPQDERLDASTYYAMERLRSELKLTHRDLVIAGCNTAETHSALTGLLDWYESNKAALYTARNRLIAARKDLFEASRSSDRGGPPDLSDYAQAVASAQLALEDVKAQAVTQAEIGFSETQKQRLAAARRNTDILGDLRYIPSLSETQKERIAAAQSERSPADAVLSTAGLSSSQQQELAAMRTGADQRGVLVAAGEATALPVPASILAERAAIEAAAEVQE